ncbi:MAG: hypothetical protein JW889_06120 [Verrucomicrobia bacterium]|nr:hypothetical protein [Verrucomicrobiota bacterium]
MGTRLLLLPLFLLLFAPTLAHADGKVFTRSADYSAFEAANQKDQRAVIFLRDGRERLLITINYYADPDEQGLWIFPVPGTPDTVHIDLWDTLPTFRGRDDRPWARRIVGKTMLIMRATQFYPLIFDLGLRAAIRKTATDEDTAKEAEVHQTIRRWGLQAEMVTAPSIEALAEHLRGASREIAPDELRAFEPYLTADYVLVVARVASRAELDREFGLDQDDPYGPYRDMRRPCLLVEFPTKRAFYPMRPTASYGDEYVPATIYVIGHVWPEADREMLDSTRVHHFRDENIRSSLEAFCGIAQGSVVDYTVVETFGPAKTYTSDFTFAPVPTSGFRAAAFIIDQPGTYLLLAVLTFLILSAFSGAMAGAIARIGTAKGAGLGLLNIASVLCVTLGAVAWLGRGRVARFVVAFSLIFVALTLVVQLVLFLNLAEV